MNVGVNLELNVPRTSNFPPVYPAAPRSPPGAPRRHQAPLPPPPEVPASVLAALRPASAPPARMPRNNGRCGGVGQLVASAVVCPPCTATCRIAIALLPHFIKL